MHWTEILAIALLVAYLAAMIGIYIYKKVKHKPIVTCSCGHAITGKKLVKAYHKANEKKCCCHCEKSE